MTSILEKALLRKTIQKICKQIGRKKTSVLIIQSKCSQVLKEWFNYMNIIFLLSLLTFTIKCKISSRLYEACEISPNKIVNANNARVQATVWDRTMSCTRQIPAIKYYLVPRLNLAVRTWGCDKETKHVIQNRLNNEYLKLNYPYTSKYIR